MKTHIYLYDYIYNHNSRWKMTDDSDFNYEED